jgi:hypothetical protein
MNAVESSSVRLLVNAAAASFALALAARVAWIHVTYGGDLGGALAPAHLLLGALGAMVGVVASDRLLREIRGHHSATLSVLTVAIVVGGGAAGASVVDESTALRCWAWRCSKGNVSWCCLAVDRYLGVPSSERFVRGLFMSSVEYGVYCPRAVAVLSGNDLSRGCVRLHQVCEAVSPFQATACRSVATLCRPNAR